GPPIAQQSLINQIHTPSRALRQADATHGVSKIRITWSRFSDQNVFQCDAFDKTTRIADYDSVLLPPHMRRAETGIVPMHERIDERLTERARIVVWRWH